MFARFIAAVLLVLASAAAVKAETRVALVIGNGDYAELTPRLPNPARDATAIGKTLAGLGFDVEVVADATKDAMEDATARLARKARSADVVLLFYAGHGIQDLGKNYLAPVDAALADETDLRRRFVRLDDILDDLAAAKGAVILILDACRDNIAVEALREAVPKTRSTGVSRGLAPVPKTNGLLVAFATQPTRVADDGVDEHSPFTKALLAHLADPNAEFRTVLSRVRVAVAKATDNRQIPETSDSLLGEVYLVRTAAVETSADRDGELLFWDSIKDSRFASDFEAYLEQFPNGLFAALARSRLAALETARADDTADKTPVTAPVAVVPPEPAPDPFSPVVTAPSEASRPHPSSGLIPGCTRRPCGEALILSKPQPRETAPLVSVAPEPAPAPIELPTPVDPNFGASGIPGCTKRPCPEAYQ